MGGALVSRARRLIAEAASSQKYRPSLVYERWEQHYTRAEAILARQMALTAPNASGIVYGRLAAFARHMERVEREGPTSVPEPDRSHPIYAYDAEIGF